MPKTKISWSDEALSTLDQILEYIFKKWGINPVLNLLDELEKLISALGNNKQLARILKFWDFENVFYPSKLPWFTKFPNLISKL